MQRMGMVIGVKPEMIAEYKGCTPRSGRRFWR